MLPQELLRARIGRGGRIRPLFVQPDDADTLYLARRIVEAFSSSVGQKKGRLMESIRAIELQGRDFKLVRGLAHLLERRCNFSLGGSWDPPALRRQVFEEASRRRVLSWEAREELMRELAPRLGMKKEELEEALWSDLEEELILRSFDPLEPQQLLRHYNLSLAQTLLFRCLRMEFRVLGDWKGILRRIKLLGLMYSIEERGEGRGLLAVVEGPLSLLKMTERYGTAMAKLLPTILRADDWWIGADIVGKGGSRIYRFEADGREVKGLLDIGETDEGGRGEEGYDSSVEERFARSFASCGLSWRLRREPEPLLAGGQLIIPDFSFELRGRRVYLEIVGFWTKEYLERKIRKLSQLKGIDLLVAVDESLACSKLERIPGKVIYFTKEVPLRPILEHLKGLEGALLEEEVLALRGERIEPKGEVVSLEALASERGVSVEALRRALEGFAPKGYRMVGDYLIAEEKLKGLKASLERLGEARLADAIALIEAEGLKNPEQVLGTLGYTIAWEGLDYQRSRIVKAERSS